MPCIVTRSSDWIDSSRSPNHASTPVGANELPVYPAQRRGFNSDVLYFQLLKKYVTVLYQYISDSNGHNKEELFLFLYRNEYATLHVEIQIFLEESDVKYKSITEHFANAAKKSTPNLP